MKISAEQLPQQLQKNLAPVYLLHGDEILLMQEAITAIRQAAAQQGFHDYQRVDSKTPDDWEKLLALVQTRNLFADKQLIECQLSDGKLNQAAQNFLQYYLKTLPQDKILILTCARLPATASLLNELTTAGIIVTIWPVTSKTFPQWLNKRLQIAGFKVEVSTLQLICEHLTGNLLAASQFIEKLTLLYAPGQLTTAQIIDCLSPSAQFTVFHLADAIAQRQLTQIQTILQTLAATGTEPPLVLWAIARECRKRQQWALLSAAAKTDQIIKGICPGDSWLALQQLCFLAAGQPLFKQGLLA